jgi:hypothetical protein
MMGIEELIRIDENRLEVPIVYKEGIISPGGVGYYINGAYFRGSFSIW